MQKKITDTLTMTSNYRHIVTQTDFTTVLTRLDRQCGHTGTHTADKEEKRKSHRFAFLKISTNAHLAHLQSRRCQHSTQALRKSQILHSPKKTVTLLK